MEASIGFLPTGKMVTRSRRFRQLQLLVVLRIECKNEGGAEKESSIPRSMSRIGWIGCLQHRRSAQDVAAAAVQPVALTAKRSFLWVMGRGSGKFEDPAGLAPRQALS
jgi:hypothetical protein